MIGIYNLEGYPNFALEKVKFFFGSDCEPYAGELFNDKYEKVFVSSLFTWTNKIKPFDNWIVGGSGYDLKIKLPFDIDCVKPRVNFGFTSRGCVNSCDFCCVRDKEGSFEIVGDLLDLWDGKSNQIDILDNNPTVNFDHFKLICDQSIKYNIRLNFHALDFRTLNDDLCYLLSKIKHTEYRFAFDDISYKDSVLSVISLLKKYNIRSSTWYVLVGFNSSFDDDLERLYILKENNQNAFVQIFNKYDNPKFKKYINLARWSNQHAFFKKMDYYEFLNLSRAL